MSKSDKNNSGQIKKIKSDTDAIFDDAEKEFQELLKEAREIVKNLQRKNDQSDKI